MIRIIFLPGLYSFIVTTSFFDRIFVDESLWHEHTGRLYKQAWYISAGNTMTPFKTIEQIYIGRDGACPLK